MGLSTERIVGNGSATVEHLTCAICHDVLWKSQACEKCEQAFCTDCIDKWLRKQQGVEKKTCPNTCEYKQRSRLPPLLVQLLSKLNVTCDYASNGCEEVIPYEAVEQHEKQCNYQRLQCEGCLKLLLKKNIDQHQRICDQIRIECSKCQLKFKRIDGHEPVQCLENRLTARDKVIDQLVAAVDKLQKENEILKEHAKKIIVFDDIPNAKETEGQIPIGYCGMNWENVYFIHVSFAKEVDKRGPGYHFSKIFGTGQTYSAMNAHGKPMSISSCDKHKKISVESFEIMSASDSPLEIIISGSRNGNEQYTKTVSLKNERTSVMLNWANIDKIAFQIPTQQWIAIGSMKMNLF